MNTEKISQNKNESLEEKISGLFKMTKHHISQFLLGSRMSNEWYTEQLGKSMQVVNELRQATQDQETISKLDELLGKMQEVDTTGAVDKDLLNEIQEKMEEVFNSRND